MVDFMVAPLYYCPCVPKELSVRTISSEAYDRLIEAVESDEPPKEALVKLLEGRRNYERR